MRLIPLPIPKSGDLNMAKEGQPLPPLTPLSTSTPIPITHQRIGMNSSAGVGGVLSPPTPAPSPTPVHRWEMEDDADEDEAVDRDTSMDSENGANDEEDMDGLEEYGDEEWTGFGGKRRKEKGKGKEVAMRKCISSFCFLG